MGGGINSIFVGKLCQLVRVIIWKLCVSENLP